MISSINCRIEGVVAKSIKRKTPRVHKNSSAPKSKIIFVLIVFAIGAFVYQRLNLNTTEPLQQSISTSSNLRLMMRSQIQMINQKTIHYLFVMVDSIAAKWDLVQKLCFSTTNVQTLKWMVIMMVFLVREILAFNRE